MATFWVSTSGDDGNAGTTYGTAKATLKGALLIASQGDTVNMVNDGVHDAYSSTDRGAVTNSFIGTDFDTDPAIIIQGTDSSGNPAVTTIAAGPTNTFFVVIAWLAAYTVIRGLKFDYSALATTAVTSQQPIYCNGQVASIKITECQFWGTSALGDSITNSSLLTAPIFLGASAGNTADHEFEVSYCLFVNCNVRMPGVGRLGHNFHHNILINDADTSSNLFNLNIPFGTSLYNRYYNNTIIQKSYDTEEAKSIITVAGNNTTFAAFHSNFFYVDAGTAAGDVDTFSGPVQAGYVAATQTTSVITMGYDAFVFGPNIAPDFGSWGASDGYGSYQFSPTWRAGGANDTTTLEPTSVSTFSQTYGDVFNDTASTYLWDTGDYSVVLPFDLRPTFARDVGLDGRAAGALADGLNLLPVVSDWNGFFDRLEVVVGDTVSVTAGDGLDTCCSDPDGDTLTYNVVDDVTHGSLTLNSNGSFSYTPNTTYVGYDAFSFEACDGTTCISVIPDSSTNPQVYLFVSNATPVIDSTLSYTVNQGQVLSATAGAGLLSNATDPEGLTLVATNLSTPAHGSVTFSQTTGAFTYTPNTWFAGNDSFTYQVSDGANTADGSVLIQVLPVESPDDPTVLIDSFPFFRPVLKGYASSQVRIQRNTNRGYIDRRHYLDETFWNESTVRYLQVDAASNVTMTLGGVAETQALMLQTDQQLAVTVVWNTDSGTDSFQATVEGCMMFDQAPISSLNVSNTASTTANVHLTVFE